MKIEKGEIIALSKEYLSGENKTCAVDGITIQFEQGEFCAITGPSGSGKSTFLHLISSLEKATDGEVLYNSKKLSKYNDNQLSVLRRRRFGFVFQAYNLVAELTSSSLDTFILNLLYISKYCPNIALASPDLRSLVKYPPPLSFDKNIL